METFSFKPIGIIFTPYQDSQGTPIQAAASLGVQGRIQIFPEYQEGLQDVDGFSHLILIYVFHLCRDYSLQVKPFLDDVKRGVFATRAPARPNPIGLSVVRLKRVEEETLYISDVDMLDGTPLLDLKPYVPEFDHRAGARIGWLRKNLDKLKNAKDDGRFLR
ncbi:MAG: tRNA (N6-threonylcarbamoyladenosine(37)-N6)-methyltransferase TrmO [Pseudomonadota bacterium]